MADSGSSATRREEELAELFRIHRDGLAGAVRAVLGAPDDGAEVLQDAFLNALRALRRGHRPDDSVAWVFVITINAAKDRRRRIRRRLPVHGLEEVSDMELTAKDRPPGASAEVSEALGAARAAIARLDEPEKEVFLLRVSGGMTFEAAAAALRIPIGTAKTRMRAALARLRRDLDAFAPDQLANAARPQR
jgi:RNA polymerase sigma-70 factor (ECF subfamily)